MVGAEAGLGTFPTNNKRKRHLRSSLVYIWPHQVKTYWANKIMLYFLNIQPCPCKRFLSLCLRIFIKEIMRTNWVYSCPAAAYWKVSSFFFFGREVAILEGRRHFKQQCYGKQPLTCFLIFLFSYVLYERNPLWKMETLLG